MEKTSRNSLWLRAMRERLLVKISEETYALKSSDIYFYEDQILHSGKKFIGMSQSGIIFNKEGQETPIAYVPLDDMIVILDLLQNNEYYQ